MSASSSARVDRRRIRRAEPQQPVAAPPADTPPAVPVTETDVLRGQVAELSELFAQSEAMKATFKDRFVEEMNKNIEAEAKIKRLESGTELLRQHVGQLEAKLAEMAPPAEKEQTHE